METFLAVASWVLPLAYLALVIDYGATFFLKTRTNVRSPWVAAVIVVHAAFLAVRAVRLGQVPLASGYDVLSLVALSSALVYYVTEVVSRDRRSGVFVFLAVFLLQYTSSMFLRDVPTMEAGQVSVAGGWRNVHTVAATFSYTALAFAAVHAGLYLTGRRNLKQHRFGLLLDRLAPLEVLAKSIRYALLAGFIFMTLSVASGSAFFGQMKQADPGAAMGLKLVSKIVMGSLTWVICGVAVFGRAIGKWSDRTLSCIAAGGFVAVLILFIASLALS